MQGNIVPPKTTPRSHLSESEAALQLGMSVEQFRNLVRETIGTADPDLKGAELKALPSGFFHPSDVVMLRMQMLARTCGGATTPSQS